MDPKNALAKHSSKFHPGLPSEFSTSIIDRQKYNMQRYISESLYIEKSTKENNVIVLNSKSEWGRQELSRINITNNPSLYSIDTLRQ